MFEHQKLSLFYSCQLRKRHHFRPFLFWQGFSSRKVTRIVCFGWYDCYCMYIIVIGFSKYTSRYLSDFTKYFSFFKDCQFKSGSVWFSIFQHYFFKRWWHEYWNHRIQNIWGQRNWGKVSISQRKIKKNWVWKQVKMKVLWTKQQYKYRNK